jgi:hypothetical protein
MGNFFGNANISMSHGRLHLLKFMQIVGAHNVEDESAKPSKKFKRC